MEKAEQCDCCRRLRYDVEKVALLVEGQVRVERDLCAACRMDAIDTFITETMHDSSVVRT